MFAAPKLNIALKILEHIGEFKTRLLVKPLGMDVKNVFPYPCYVYI